MNGDHAPSERSFAVTLALAAAVVVAVLGALAFLRSDAGRHAFLDESSRQTFVPRNAAVVLAGTGEELIVPLGTARLDGDSRYLLVAELDAGRRVTFAGWSRQGRVRFRCPSRLVASECHRLVEADELAGRLKLRAIYTGHSDLVLRGLSLARISPLYFALRPLLLILLWAAPLAFLLRHRRRLTAALRTPRPLDEVAFALLLFGVCFGVYHRAPVHQVLDSRYLTAVSHSVVHGRGVVLPDDFRAAREARRYQIDRVGGRLLHHYSPVPAVLDAPIVAVYEAFGVTPELPGGGWDRGVETRIMRFSAGAAAALLCVVLYLIARRFLPPLTALPLAAVFAFGTQILSTLSRPYWAHTWGAVRTGAAILLVLTPWRCRPMLSTGLAATLVSLGFYCRPQTVWTVVGLTAFLALSRDRRRLATLVAVGAGWALLGVALSLAVYGSVLPEYFFASQVERGRLDPESLDSYRYVTGTLGALVSPGRGLFVYSPILLWVLWQAARGWRSLPSRRWAGVALGVVVAHHWMLVHTGVWPGGQSYGARLFSDVVVWFFLLAVLVVAGLGRRWRELRPAARRMEIAVAALLVAASIWINYRGAFAKATWTWSSYDRPHAWLLEGGRPLLPQPEFWNWRYPQFMAGLLPHDRYRQPAPEVAAPNDTESARDEAGEPEG